MQIPLSKLEENLEKQISATLNAAPGRQRAVEEQRLRNMALEYKERTGKFYRRPYER